MSDPRRVHIDVYGTPYYLTVDLSKWDCNREPPHCHVCKGRDRVAQVWLSSCSYKEEPREISHNQRQTVLNAVRENMYELKSAFNHNHDYGADQ